MNNISPKNFLQVEAKNLENLSPIKSTSKKHSRHESSSAIPSTSKAPKNVPRLSNFFDNQ